MSNYQARRRRLAQRQRRRLSKLLAYSAPETVAYLIERTAFPIFIKKDPPGFFSGIPIRKVDAPIIFPAHIDCCGAPPEASNP